MLIQKDNPVGIDIPIQRFQSFLHGRLLTKWGINTAAYRCYPRCYRNKTADGYIAENYEGGGEYREVYWDDVLSALSFLGLSTGMREDTGHLVAGVHLVFFVNLAKLYPTIPHRADEEARKEVLQIVGKGMHGLNFTGVDMWLENVLREYPGSRREDRLKFVDMHPIHCFRLNFSTTYQINNC